MSLSMSYLLKKVKPGSNGAKTLLKNKYGIYSITLSMLCDSFSHSLNPQAI